MGNSRRCARVLTVAGLCLLGSCSQDQGASSSTATATTESGEASGAVGAAKVVDPPAAPSTAGLSTDQVPADELSAGKMGVVPSSTAGSVLPVAQHDGGALPGAVAVDAGVMANPDTSEPSTPLTAQPPAHWRQGTQMPTPRSELATALLDGRVYVAGGYGGLDRFEAYEIAANRWEERARLPLSLEHPCLAALAGQVYLSCGSQARMFAYDPVSNRWEERAPLPEARWGATAVGYKGSLFIVAGQAPAGLVVQRYDPDLDQWEEAGQLDTVRDHAPAVLLDDMIYVLGGRPGRGEVYDTTVVYDPMRGTVTPGPALDEPRSGFAAAIAGGWLCVAGGEILVQPYEALDRASCMDPRTGEWTAIAALPTPLHGMDAVGYEGRMYVFGGATRPARASSLPGAVNILEP